MAQSTSDKLNDIWEQAHSEFDKSVSATYEQRKTSLEDRRIANIAGAAWEGMYGETFANKPKLEFNKLNLAVYRIINEWRANRITVDFVSKDGVEDDSLTDLCDGLFRADEQDSRATEAYDVAFEEMATGGYGAWRLTAQYEDEYDEEDDRQRIRIEPIPDADTTVYWDSNARFYDKSDAKFCFVLTGYSAQAYEEEFGESPEDWGRPVSDVQFDWWDGDDRVYVAEYYKKVEDSYKVLRFQPVGEDVITVAEDDFTEEMQAEFLAVGTVLVGEKTVKRCRVRKYTMSGGGILEDHGYIAGKCIPIIPCYGKRVFVDGRERWAGAVRYAKDPQRLYNMQVSYLADVAARGGYRKPIFTPEQVAGHETAWATDAEKNHAYLLLNPLTDAQGNEQPAAAIGFTEPPETPPAMAALLQLVDQNIFDILGNQEAGDEVDTQLSGKAVELIQTRLDQQAYIYMSNFAKSMRRSGEVWLSMASEVYTEEGRKMKMVGRTGETEPVIMNEGAVFEEDGTIVTDNDLSRAKMDVTADVGPSSSSKRSATVRTLSQLMGLSSDPQDQKILSSLIMMNMEGEGISDVREYYRKTLVDLGVQKPTEQDKLDAAEAQSNQQPDANQVYLFSEAQKNEAQTEESRARSVKAIADAQKAEAETAETLAGIDRDDRQQVIDTVEQLRDAGTATPPNVAR